MHRFVTALLILATTVSCGPAPTASEALPAGWIRHTADKFEIGAPADWISLSQEGINAAEGEIVRTYPDLIPVVQGLIENKAVKFLALDPKSTKQPWANINVISRRRVGSLDQYTEGAKKEAEQRGMHAVIGDKVRVKDDQASRLTLIETFPSRTGSTVRVNHQVIIIDHREERYEIMLSYPPDEAEKYTPVFDSVVGSFRVIK